MEISTAKTAIKKQKNDRSKVQMSFGIPSDILSIKRPHPMITRTEICRRCCRDITVDSLLQIASPADRQFPCAEHDLQTENCNPENHLA